MATDEKTAGQQPRSCFVVGPIGKDGSTERKHADLLLNAVIKHVLENEAFGYKVKRADQDADPGMIGDRVITDVIKSSLVVADLTDLNPNAFYELGIRHSTGAVAGLVGIEGGVVSGVTNLESSGVEASEWRPRHGEQYHEA